MRTTRRCSLKNPSTLSKRLFTLLAVSALLVGLLASGTAATDHLDAPALNPARLEADIAGLYVFTGAEQDNTVLAMTSGPAAGAIAPASFGPDVLYEILVTDLPGSSAFDVAPDRAFRFSFGPVSPDGSQTVTMRRADGAAAAGHTATGATIVQGVTNTIIPIPGGGWLFAGLRSDPHFFDLGGFFGSIEGVDNGRALGDGNEVDFFDGLGVMAIVLELPDAAVGPGVSDGSVSSGVGVWGSTSVATDQLDRVGRPMTNILANSTGPIVSAPSPNKDLFNASEPKDDAAFEQTVKDALAALSALDSEGAYSTTVIDSLTSALLPDLLFFNKTQSPFPGFNGRRLEDDVVDIMLNIWTGGAPFVVVGRDNQGAIPTDGIGPHSNYLPVFPYLGEPARLCFGRPVTIPGTAGDDVLIGTPGTDVIDGGDGNDFIDGGFGDDFICAGDGRDIVLGGPGRDFILGQGGGDDLKGQTGNDLIRGGPGLDSVNGGPGDDTLRGDADRDFMSSGPGTDLVDGGPGIDTIDYRFAGGPMIINLSAGTATGADIDTLIGFENAHGSTHADHIVGTRPVNVLRGFEGRDRIEGLAGDDLIYGFDGNDLLFGGPGDDRLFGFRGRDYLAGGTGDDELRGGSQDDTILGGGGNDLMIGQFGADELFGGAGFDRAQGGPGIDACIAEFEAGCER